jgi:DNA-binding PadR family transcriptional regulator
MPALDILPFLPLKPAHFHILLAASTGPVHGYGIRRQVEEQTDGAIVLAAGTLYETIQRMERDRLIGETAAPDELEAPASSRWRFYETTSLGRQVRAAEVRRLESDVSAARSRLPALG